MSVRNLTQLSRLKIFYKVLGLFIILTMVRSFLVLPINAKASTVPTQNPNNTEEPLLKVYQKIYGNSKFSSYYDFVNAVSSIKKDQKEYDSSKFPFEKLVEEINGNKRVDVGDDFMNDMIKYNNRLDYYDLYIKLAKEKGYIVTSYIDYLTNYKDTDKKVLILRHDIDVADDATQKMIDIEKNNNVKATYYFRWETFDKALIKEVESAGFEVGLHYETIATYCIKNKKYKIDNTDLAKCRELLKEEIKQFKEKSGIDIKTIASHGNPVNKKINIPNCVLLKGQKYKDFGIVSETYDDDILNNYVKSYICDGEIVNNFGYSYDTNPIDSIMKGDKVIEFLSHPNHWNYNVYERAELYLNNKKS